MTLGEHIFQLRKTRNLSKEQLGEQIGVTRQTISNWELNETAPNSDQLKLLSKALATSIDDLLENDTHSILMGTVARTERQTSLVKKTLIVIAIVLGVQILITLIGFLMFYLMITGSLGKAPQFDFSYSGTLEPAFLGALSRMLQLPL